VRVFATVGLEAFAFERFVAAIDTAVAEGLLPPGTVLQYGSVAKAPQTVSGSDFFDYAQMCEHIAKADVVVTHAGVGTFLHCHDMGKAPVLVARHHRLGEHVDDHQVEFAAAVERLGLALVADPEGALDAKGLAVAIAERVRDAAAAGPVAERASDDGLRAHLAALLAADDSREGA